MALALLLKISASMHATRYIAMLVLGAMTADLQIGQLPGADAPADPLLTMQRAGELKGVPVRDQAGAKVGRIEDFVIDLGSGRVVAVLVEPAHHSSDGLAVVPANCFTAADQFGALLEGDQRRFDGAPRLKLAKQDIAVPAKSLAESRAYFKKEPVTDQALLKVSGGPGFVVVGSGNEILGKLIDLTLDVPSGRIFFAVIAPEGNSGMLCAAPPRALASVSKEGTLQLNIAKAKFAGLAHRENIFWKALKDPACAAACYQVYGQEPNFGAAGAAAPPPATYASGRSDAELSKSILMAMVSADSDYTFAYKNITICSVNGHVTLRGKAKNEKLKASLFTTAQSVAGAGNVDNQIEVHK
jgi:sporulation protein YlmC with PRC-barrel domain